VEKNSRPPIILVYGAWADATGWQHVIPILLDAGYDVSAVQLWEKSLANDIATTQRVIDAQKGPVVLVGHSYGGAVVSGAAADRNNVKALVYSASFRQEQLLLNPNGKATVTLTINIAQDAHWESTFSM
jgi:pimeloyl-ACP methyl ester carboxylesterase